jgi:F-type H+-transporting ATPase subunit a
MGSLLAAGDSLSHVVQHTWIWLAGEPNTLFSFPLISNIIVMQVLGAALLVWLIPRAVRMRAGDDPIGRLVTRGFGTAIEYTCVALREQIFRPNLQRYTDAFTPFLWSLFFFILAANVLGLLPLSDWFYFVPHHLIGGTPTSNFYVTGALAAVTLVLIVYNGLRLHGLDYIKHFFLGPWWISWFIAILEIAGLGFKCGALCIRLTANMLAGHIMLAVLLGFVGSAFAKSLAGGVAIGIAVVGGSVLVYFLEILVAFLHAFIFTTLTAVFIGMAVNIHGDEHEEHAESHAAGAVPAAHG